MVFVRCTELERRNSVSEIPYITRYLTEKPGSYKAAIVPDSQMDAFIAMVASAGGEVALIDRPLSPGDLVRVKHGALEGKVAELVKVEGKDCLAVRLPILGAACVQIDRNSVELITK
jgi:transcription antitermination factor NusG